MKVPDLKSEWWLAEKVYGQELVKLFYGVTDESITKDRMRKEIIARKLGGRIVGKIRGTELSFAAAFERLYGEPLIREAA